MNIGEKIAAARKAKGWSREDLGRKGMFSAAFYCIIGQQGQNRFRKTAAQRRAMTG